MPPNNFRCTSPNWERKKKKPTNVNHGACLNNLWNRVLIDNGNDLSGGKDLKGTKSLVEEKS